MAFKMKPPGKMRSAFRKSTMLKFGRTDIKSNPDAGGMESRSNTGLLTDSGGIYYNNNLGPMRMVNPSALKQMEDESTMTREEIEALEREVEPGGGDEKNIGLLPSEMEGTWVYEGTNINERINDYEDRISFIEEDVWNQQEGDPNAPVDMSQATDQQKKDHATLTRLVEELYAERQEGGK